MTDWPKEVNFGRVIQNKTKLRTHSDSLLSTYILFRLVPTGTNDRDNDQDNNTQEKNQFQHTKKKTENLRNIQELTRTGCIP